MAMLTMMPLHVIPQQNSPVAPSLGDDYFSPQYNEPHIPPLSTSEYEYLLYRMRLLEITKKFSGSFTPQPSEILPQLWISDLYNATSPHILDDLGITHILSVKSAYTILPFGDGSRFEHQSVSIEDVPEHDILTHLESSTHFIQNALSKKSEVDARVMVHCNLGNGPSAALVIGYLIAVHYMSYDAALAFLRSRRPFVEINHGFEKQLREWEERTRSRLEDALFRSLAP